MAFTFEIKEIVSIPAKEIVILQGNLLEGTMRAGELIDVLLEDGSYATCWIANVIANQKFVNEIVAGEAECTGVAVTRLCRAVSKVALNKAMVFEQRVSVPIKSEPIKNELPQLPWWAFWRKNHR